MTKVIILGQEPKEEKKLKPIYFQQFLKRSIDNGFCRECSDPKEWDNIELISLNYTEDGLDLMYAYDKRRNEGYLYLGHFNDGVVE